MRNRMGSSTAAEIILQVLGQFAPAQSAGRVKIVCLFHQGIIGQIGSIVIFVDPQFTAIDCGAVILLPGSPGLRELGPEKKSI